MKLSLSEFIRECLPIIISHEGGYVKRPSDPGGETKYGISKRAYPYVDIKNLTQAQAGKFYHKDYYLKSKIYLLPHHLQYLVLDYCINSGNPRAIKHLQEVIGSEADGLLGKKTVSKLRGYLKKEWKNETGDQKFLRKYRGKRIGFMAQTTIFWEYHKGWLKRINKCEEHALKILKHPPQT